MLKSALILGMAATAAGSAASDTGKTGPNGAFVLFSGGVPTLQINTGARACPFEAPKASSARRSKPVFALY
ncbi:hypothetical protein [Sphingosinicella microcystinivorans]|uniref:Uncharacterized protein n=1 Tax=Sphingosinicella microcystinivorans TaxID=335406 RepID=A0AAD1D706_SPHMI|nr:hypothetical protein [Sphingosinicella microcystinivorans]RKS92043.1 hypothetical protein DFR51_1619 [Sphingosinicella microcystinivorans]BBE35063.1 hypothetical protein SmB9_27210 [Sphingosinicella microcystinivorans]